MVPPVTPDTVASAAGTVVLIVVAELTAVAPAVAEIVEVEVEVIAEVAVEVEEVVTDQRFVPRRTKNSCDFYRSAAYEFYPLKVWCFRLTPKFRRLRKCRRYRRLKEKRTLTTTAPPML